MSTVHNTLEIQKAHTYTSARHSRFNIHSGQRRTQGPYPEFIKNKLILISSFIRFTCVLGVEVWPVINFWSYLAKCFHNINTVKLKSLYLPYLSHEWLVWIYPFFLPHMVWKLWAEDFLLFSSGIGVVQKAEFSFFISWTYICKTSSQSTFFL